MDPRRQRQRESAAVSPIRRAVLFVAIVFSVSLTLTIVFPPPAAPQSVWDVLAWLLPQVWAPTVIALVLVVVSDGSRGVRKEINSRLSYKPGSARWLLVAGIVPLVAQALAVVSGRAA